MVALASPSAEPDEPGPFYLALMVGDPWLEVADMLDRPAWMRDALCAEFPKHREWWFRTRGGSSQRADAICRRCLVRTECTGWALDRADIVGIWGATSSQARTEARTLGLDVAELLDAVDNRCVVSGTPSAWETAPCRGCAGLLSRRDLGIGDGWCWACRPRPSESNAHGQRWNR